MKLIGQMHPHDLCFWRLALRLYQSFMGYDVAFGSSSELRDLLTIIGGESSCSFGGLILVVG